MKKWWTEYFELQVPMEETKRVEILAYIMEVRRNKMVSRFNIMRIEKEGDTFKNMNSKSRIGEAAYDLGRY